MRYLIFFIASLLVFTSCIQDKPGKDYIIWFNKPAEYFEESFVLGNGRAGASVHGGIDTEEIYLNEATLWSGEPFDPYMNPEAYRHVAEVRKALRSEEYALADSLNRNIQGAFSESYAPLGTLFIDFDQGKLEERIKILLSQAYSPDFIETYNVKDSSSFPLTKRILNKTFKSENLFDYLYRPFDIRKIYYDVGLTSRPAYNVMRNLIYGENICLILPRICKEKNFNYGFVSNKLSDVALGGKNTGSETYVAPLYIYPFFKTPREPNFNIEFQKIINLIYSTRPSPEKIFYYIYAILYIPSYRIKYNELLKIEYPRIPFVENYNLFHKIAEYGEGLVDLHLLKSLELDPPIAKFQGDGNNIVEKVKYCEKENRLYFNQNQYFEGIKKELWQYQIGGYQVCDKWLKDRKNRTLSLEEIKHYCKIITALEKTIEFQKKIDKLYPEVEKGIIEFKSE